MFSYGTSININILQRYLLKIYLTHFMALVFFYTSWNTSENLRFLNVFRGHWKRPVAWNGLKVIWYSVTSFVTYLNNWRLFIQLKILLQNGVVSFPQLILLSNLSPITLIKLFLFFLTLLVVSVFQFEACIIYCFHV